MRLDVNNLNIYYLDQGSGIPLIFLHGLSDDCRLWLPLISHFSRNFRVLAMDLRGHGKTDKPENGYSLELFADDLYQFLSRLQPGKVNVVGLSLGGAIAQQFALDHPEMVNKLVLLSSFSQVDDELENKLKKLQEDLDTGGFPSFFDEAVQLVNTPEFIDDNQEIIGEVKIEAAKLNSPDALKRTIEGLIQWDVHDQISQVKSPTLLISGREDIFTPPHMAQKIHEAIPGSRWIILDDVGHNLLIPDKIRELKSIIEDFLDE